jgi:hypothetical protein
MVLLGVGFLAMMWIAMRHAAIDPPDVQERSCLGHT